jgi:hypothetical protein
MTKEQVEKVRQLTDGIGRGCDWCSSPATADIVSGWHKGHVLAHACKSHAATKPERYGNSVKVVAR